MKKMKFDVAAELRENFLTFPNQGTRAAAVMRERIKVEGPDTCWIVDYTSADLISYAFVASFLPVFVDDFGSMLPRNCGILVQGKKISDRGEILRGLSRGPNEIGVRSESEEIDLIGEKMRSLLLISEESDGEYTHDYLGIRRDGSEDGLIRILAMADQHPSITMDSIRTLQGLGGIEAAQYCKTLSDRRLLLTIGQSGQDDEYRSLWRLLCDQEAA